MNWSLFWTAFGAIGTTLGSLITSIAVIIAVKQYLQPITKKIQVSIGTSVPVFEEGFGEAQIHIEIKNCGIRDVTIESVYLNGRKNQLYINRIQSRMNNPSPLPVLLRPEAIYTFYIDRNILKYEISKMVQGKYISKNECLIVNVHDSLGAKHCCKKKIRVRDFVK